MKGISYGPPFGTAVLLHPASQWGIARSGQQAGGHPQGSQEREKLVKQIR